MFNWVVTPTHAVVDIGTTFGPAKSGFTSVGNLINVILPNLLTLAGIIGFIGVVIAGIRVIQHAGEGESDKTAKDKSAFTTAVIGLIIVFGAYFLIQIVNTLIGYNILSPDIK